MWKGPEAGGDMMTKGSRERLMRLKKKKERNREGVIVRTDGHMGPGK